MLGMVLTPGAASMTQTTKIPALGELIFYGEKIEKNITLKIIVNVGRL